MGFRSLGMRADMRIRGFWGVEGVGGSGLRDSPTKS